MLLVYLLSNALHKFFTKLKGIDNTFGCHGYPENQKDLV